MNSSWWRSLDELDEDQKAFILLPVHGKHLLEGPPGSGKTNLLLLRAQFMAGRGDKNILFLTYTRALTNFIQTGLTTKGLMSTTQIRTYHSWAVDHILQYLGHYAIAKEGGWSPEVRVEVLSLIREANTKLPAQNLYSAIFVDEAQDLTADELEALLCLSERVCICGDSRQGIYNRDGLTIATRLGLERHALKRHFRIGQKVARVADKLCPPNDGEESLETTSNYNPRVQGESSAKMHECATRDEQFSKMTDLIRVQLDAFNGDAIGIFCGLKDSLTEIRDRFNATEFADRVYVHGVDSDASFAGVRPIHVLTIHGAKGTEFRAVHIFGAEELKRYPLNRTRLSFTAVTRAKTSLNAYRTGDTSQALDNSFTEPSHFDLKDLFNGNT